MEAHPLDGTGSCLATGSQTLSTLA